MVFVVPYLKIEKTDNQVKNKEINGKREDFLKEVADEIENNIGHL